MEIRYNVMKVMSIPSFFGVRGRFHKDCKDVYFVKGMGVNSRYLEDIAEADSNMGGPENCNEIKYNRICKFPKLTDYNDIAKYNTYYTKADLDTLKSEQAKKRYQEALDLVIQTYKELNRGCSETMIKNFVLKILFWTDSILPEFLSEWNPDSISKLVVSGKIKLQEYLFCYFSTLMGIDVLVLFPEGEPDVLCDTLNQAGVFKIGDFKSIDVPEYKKEMIQNAIADMSHTSTPAVNAAGIETVSTDAVSNRRITMKVPPKQTAGTVRKPDLDRELSFEELAKRASSVVMISIHGIKGEVIGNGSGIMIGRDGYILTNNHVASGGCFYSVRIEDDEKIYETDEIIKYNSVLDLALIRIQRKLLPISVYHGSRELVRGQKVVAIGSPLGLFNSVSNGIISGFRSMDQVDMIQFTAPTSPGSSGGAVLNMYGEIIGISTAGMENGQNLNLAVGYKNINLFVKGFV